MENAMPLPKITAVSGRAVPALADDVDTDQIIPARFMRCVTFDGLGKFAFYDLRFDAAGKGKGHPIDDPRFAGAAVLVSGRNFGCGSSREHAPQALYRAGIRAVVAESFAEIFFGNSTTLGMPCVAASREDVRRLAAAIERDPKLAVTVDLVKMQVRFGADAVPCSSPESARKSLMDGTFDALDALLEGMPQVAALSEKLPCASEQA
jgi:3-isopropylmalate/(R)-2-methylmalate dehydratase small subunit